MITVCKSEECFACGACENICPKNCIERVYNDDSSWHMSIDENKCIHCNLCEKVCPNISKVVAQKPNSAYAAWNKDIQAHKTAASGGIASALYSYAYKNGLFFCGVELNSDREAVYSVTRDIDKIKVFRNSKYTFSFMNSIFSEIANLLKVGEKVLFIGLPCHVAALKNYVSLKKVAGELITVDLICHGTPSPSFLKEHIVAIENKKNIESGKIYFRDPQYGTGNFLLTIYNKQKISCHDKESKFSVNNTKSTPVYKKRVVSDDLYQIGYHSALIYRDCCYRCKFATGERVGDITLGDYHGLGREAPYTHERKEVSVILVNTPKGKELINLLVENNFITAYERPVIEPLKYEKQLNRPSIAPVERKVFLQKYKEIHDFELAAKYAFAGYQKKNKLKRLSPVPKVKRIIKAIVPRGLKERIKAYRRKRSNKL